MTRPHQTGIPKPRVESVDTVVIGGGQAGLAVSYHLSQRDLPHVILDGKDRIGDAWRNRWDSLRLFTPARYSTLPGMPFPAARLSYPTKDQVADYLEAYAREFRLPVRTGVRVDRLSRAGDLYEVGCGDTCLLAENVIVASGPSHVPRIPAFAVDVDARIVQLHSSEYRNPSQLSDGGVLVVGAGNSGAEIAIEVAPHHEAWLSGPDTGQEPTGAGSLPDRILMPLMWFMATRATRVTNPIGRKVRDQFTNPPRGIPLGRVRRRDITAAGIERVPRTTGVQEGRPRLAGGRVLDVANIVWCTGFTPGLGWIDTSVVPHDTLPAHDRGVVQSPAGLYFVGLPFQYSLSSALLGGVGRDAEHVARDLASRRASTRVHSP